MPPFSQEMVDDLTVITEYMMNARLNPTQRQELAAQVRGFYERNDVQTIQQLSQTKQLIARLSEIPQHARFYTRRALILDLLLKNDQSIKASGDAYAKWFNETYRKVHPPILPESPFVSAEIADAFVDSYLFINSLRANKPTPKPSAEWRQKNRIQIARDFSRLRADQQKHLIESMVQVASFQARWPQMPDYEKLQVRAGLGAPLSMEEQQLVQQINQQMRSHSISMMTNQLNSMQANQQMIMGSAPYWNPSSQRWEQKGGIVTEFR